MKVLILTREYPPHVGGGMGRAIRHIVDELHQKCGVEVTVVANQPTLGFSMEIEDGVVVYRVPTVGSTFLTKIPSFAFFASKLLAKLEKDYDLVYSASSPVFYKAKKPFIAHFRLTRYGLYSGGKENGKLLYAFLNKLYIPFDKLLLRRADGVMVLSENMIEEIEAMGGTKNEIRIVPNGVDTSLFRPLRNRKFDSNEKAILYVGRMDQGKGVDILLYAFKEVMKNTKARLMLAGDGRQKNKLLDLANSLCIPVDFLGNVPHVDLPKVYNDADLCVLPSLNEAFSLVVLEAMACGTPIIVSSACPDLGVPRFKKGDVNSLAKLLLETISSERSLQESSENVLRISRNCDWASVATQFCAFFEKFV